MYTDDNYILSIWKILLEPAGGSTHPMGPNCTHTQSNVASGTIRIHLSVLLHTNYDKLDPNIILLNSVKNTNWRKIRLSKLKKERNRMKFFLKNHFLYCSIKISCEWIQDIIMTASLYSVQISATISSPVLAW